MIRETSSVWGLITGDINDQTDLQTILNGKFDVPTGDATQYIAGDGTLITFPIAGQAGTLVREVRNRTGATLTKGTIVYINGANGNKPTVAKALATSDATSAQTFGFLQTNIANNSNGYAVVMGDLIGLDTSAITEGTQLYLSSTVAGEYTTTKQVAPAHMVYVGIVTRSHATLGQIEVKIQNGYELDELHDVLISGQTDGQVLQFEGASGLWKNKTLATGLTVGSTAISSGTDGRVLFQNGGVLQQSANLFWDNTNGRLGVGTSSPAGRFQIIAQGTASTDSVFSVMNSANNRNLISATGDGTTKIGDVYTTCKLENYGEAKFYALTYGVGHIKLTPWFGNGGTSYITAGTDLPTNGNDLSIQVKRYVTGGNLIFETNDSERMRVQWSGEVGIGTNAPSARLDVKAQGALSTDLALRVRNSANTKDIFAVKGDENSFFGGNIFVNSGANASIIELYSAFSGATELTLQSSSGDGIINSRIGLSFRLGGTQQMKFYSSTNLMIGQNLADSGYKLHVAGNFRCAPRGSLSTDIALLVRNFANTADILSIAGNGKLSYNALGGGIALLNNDGTTDIGSGGGSVTRINLLSGTTSTINMNPAGTIGTIFNSTRGGASGETAFLFNASIGNLAGTTNYGKIINIKDGRTDLGNRANTVVGLLIKRDATNTNTLLNVQALSATDGNVGFGVLINNASAKVQIDSTTQGFLPPRMTNAQRTAIASPAVGLMVYCTDAVEGLYIYKSMGWTFVI
jgi:hypothetical protein